MKFHNLKIEFKISQKELAKKNNLSNDL